MMLFLVIFLSCQLVIADECFNCSFLNRNGGECVQSFEECGECLNGYEDIKVTQGTKHVSKCKKNKFKNLVGTCNEDSDCGNNQYCFNNNCSDCFDCKLFKRFPEEGCAKQPSDCGLCLDGYVEELVTLNTYSRPCIKEKRASYSSYQQDKYEAATATTSASVGIVAIISIYLIAVIVVGAVFFVACKRSIGAANIRSDVEEPITQELEEPMVRELEEPPPPSYDQIHRVSSESEITTSVTEGKERTCLAIAFRSPQAAYYPRTSPPEPEPEDEIDNAVLEDEALPDVDDEATMPSSWTPNSSTGTVNEGDEERCSFSGVFSSSNSTETTTQSNPVELDDQNPATIRSNTVSGGIVENQTVFNNAQQSDETGETRC